MSLFVPNSNYDLKCRWRGWRCTTTRSTRSTPTPSTVSPSRWPGSCPSLLSFLLRFNLGPTSLLGPVQWKSFKPIGCPWKNFALNLLEGWVTMSEREVKPSPSAIPQTNLKLSFFGTPCTTLLFAIHAIQLSVPHHTLLLFHFWQLFDLQKYFPLENPLLSVILQTFKNFSLLNVVASAAERTVWSQNFYFDPNNAQIMFLFSTHQRKDSLRRERKSILTPHTACLVSMQRAGFII